MIYREAGQFRTSYAADQALFPIRLELPVGAATALFDLPSLARGAVHDRVAGLDGGANDYLVKLPDKIDNPGPILGELRRCREAMLSASGRVAPRGTFYQGFHMVIAAIDSLASLMIRRPEYFWDKGSSPASEAQGERQRIEREAEAGLREWPES